MNTPVLLIDDDAKLAELLKTYLENHGFALTTALTAQDGLRVLRVREFELVLLDIMLPDGDGLKYARKFVRYPPFRW